MAFRDADPVRDLQVSKSAKNQETHAKSPVPTIYVQDDYAMACPFLWDWSNLKAQAMKNPFPLLCCGCVTMWLLCDVWNGNQRQLLIRIN